MSKNTPLSKAFFNKVLLNELFNYLSSLIVDTAIIQLHNKIMDIKKRLWKIIFIKNKVIILSSLIVLLSSVNLFAEDISPVNVLLNATKIATPIKISWYYDNMILESGSIISVGSDEVNFDLSNTSEMKTKDFVLKSDGPVNYGRIVVIKTKITSEAFRGIVNNKLVSLENLTLNGKSIKIAAPKVNIIIPKSAPFKDVLIYKILLDNANYDMETVIPYRYYNDYITITKFYLSFIGDKDTPSGNYSSNISINYSID